MKKSKLILSIGLIISLFTATKVTFANVPLSVFINGEYVDVETKLINDTTYIPLRAVAELLGAKVEYRDSTKSIFITTNTTINEPVNIPTSEKGYSKDNPASIGTKLQFATTNLVGLNYSGTVNIEQVIRGQKANDLIRETSFLNSEPDEGYEYMLVKATITISDVSEKDAIVELTNGSFKAISSDGKEYKTPSALPPEPTFNAKLYKGGSHTGWFPLMVRKDDPAPLLTFARNYDGTKGIWFKTNP